MEMEYVLRAKPLIATQGTDLLIAHINAEGEKALVDMTVRAHPSVVKFGVSISGLAIAAVTASFQTPAKHPSPRNGDWLVFGNTRLYTVCGVCSSDTRCLGLTDGCMSLVFPCLVFGNTKLHD